MGNMRRILYTTILRLRLHTYVCMYVTNVYVFLRVYTLAYIIPYARSTQLNINYYSINSTNAHHTLEALTVCMSSTVLIVV